MKSSTKPENALPDIAEQCTNSRPELKIQEPTDKTRPNNKSSQKSSTSEQSVSEPVKSQ